MNENKRVLYFDILAIIACIMVVFFHCNTIFYEFSNTVSWKISAVERCIVFSAIPVFFMLTGAKLLNYREKYSTKEYLKKRVKKTGIPFLFWNLFYIGIIIAVGNFRYKSIGAFLSAFLNSDFQSRYWFFFPLFAVYAAIPVLSLLLKAENHRKYLWYYVGISFASSWLIRPIFALLGIGYSSYLRFPLSSGFMMYAVFGYLVSTGVWKKKYRVLLYVATLLSEIFVILYTIYTSASAGQTNQYMINYEFFPSALMGASIFVFFRHLNLSHIGEKAVGILRTLAECGMGVWLTHSLVITVIQKVTGMGDESYLLRFAMPLVVYAVCVTGVWIAKKIPFVKRVV